MLPELVRRAHPAHISTDRALGLRLQCPDGSGCTHLREARRTPNRPDPGGGAWTG
jgi:hypothetical protein